MSHIATARVSTIKVKVPENESPEDFAEQLRTGGYEKCEILNEFGGTWILCKVPGLLDSLKKKIFGNAENRDTNLFLTAKELLSIAKSLTEEGPELPEIGHITCHCGHHWDIEVDDEEPLLCHECGCALDELDGPMAHDESSEDESDEDEE